MHARRRRFPFSSSLLHSLSLFLSLSFSVSPHYSIKMTHTCWSNLYYGASSADNYNLCTMYNIFYTVSQDTISRYLTVLHVTIKKSDARKRMLSTYALRVSCTKYLYRAHPLSIVSRDTCFSCILFYHIIDIIITSRRK